MWALAAAGQPYKRALICVAMQLHEEDELTWDDGSVNPEPCLDEFKLVSTVRPSAQMMLNKRGSGSMTCVRADLATSSLSQAHSESCLRACTARQLTGLTAN